MDIIIGLPESEGCSSIWVIGDRFTNVSHFIPIMPETPISDVPRIFLSHVWNLHVIHGEIIFDRDPRFDSWLGSSRMALLGVDDLMTTAYDPQTDGQRQGMNQTLKQYLRNYYSYEQDN